MFLSVLMLGSCHLFADDLDEFRIKRETDFEFAGKPSISHDGRTTRVTFTTSDYCDVTVGIENDRGRIIRHLASGVLGRNAPKPFQKNSKRQTILWDRKNDQGNYVDDVNGLTVRVSLGLNPQFERTLLWSPHKQRSVLPIMAASRDGVYVFDAGGVDHLRLFDHDGNYVRTVYPFPANRLKDVDGLRWHDFPQGYERPLKESNYQQTLLTSGDNDSIFNRIGMTGRAATGLAVRGQRIALVYEHLNRLSANGSSGGLRLKGPSCSFEIQKSGYGSHGRGKQVIGPTSLVFSPDGKTLYMTGYLWKQYSRHNGCYHAVLKLDYGTDAEPTVFAGSRDRKEFGGDDQHLAAPTSVACDVSGNVYVSDFLNNRVQVFEPSGKHLKTIPTDRPAKVLIHQKTGEIFVFSWAPIGIPGDAWKEYKYEPDKVKNTLTRFRPLPGCEQVSTEPFPLGHAAMSRVFVMGQLHQVELDSWAPGSEPVFWVVNRAFIATRADHRILFIDYSKTMDARKWRGVRIVKKKDGKWAASQTFGQLTAQKVNRITPIKHNIQQIYVNPVTGMLYVGEADSGATIKAFNRLLEINPESGSVKSVNLPFNALDIAFDLDGVIYLRTTDVVVRYDPGTWREIPWDYGEELSRVTSGMSGRTSPAISGLVMPTVSPVCFHQGGMSVSPKGHLAVACSNRPKGRKVHTDFSRFGKTIQHGKPYRPRMYPGREESSTSCSVHVWDKHGKVVYEDAVWGLPQVDGIEIDRDDNIFVMATPTRILNGKRYFNEFSETLIKFRPGKAKILSSSGGPIPLPGSETPKREPDLQRGGRKIWVEDAEWFYGGVGYAGFNTQRDGGGCACWFARFKLDHFARSFAPEPYQYSVAVLDTNGNLITRIGRYGNVDDGKPLDPTGGPPDPRSIGSDEVGLFHADFVGVHTDRRLFIADLGNARIVSVKLGYHTTERIAVKMDEN